MPRRKKIVKRRGSKTHGWGSKKKHRGAGSRGGRGLAGSKKHKKTWIMKYKRDHLGKRGFKSLQKRRIKEASRAINIRNIPANVLEGMEIDVTKLGYDKLLGNGEFTKPVTVKARAFSEKAKEKIEKAKGKAVVVE